MDFEVSARNAVQSVFVGCIKIHLCYYHFKQSIIRKLKSPQIRLIIRFRNDPDFQEYIFMLCAIAFLPPAFIPVGFEYVNNYRQFSRDSSVGKLLTYFDSTYVNGSGTSGPKFEPETWSDYDETLTDKARTNNICEGWNHGFSKRIGHNHPNVFFLINKMREEWSVQEQGHLNRLMGYNGRAPLTKYVGLQKRLKTLCVKYRDSVIALPPFLLGIAKNMKKTMRLGSENDEDDDEAENYISEDDDIIALE
jgi:hypothetical protein